MRIVYLTHQYFPRHIGGTEIYTRGLARRARDRGDEVLIITHHEVESADPTKFGVVETQIDEVPVIEVHHNLGAEFGCLPGTSGRRTGAEFDNPVIAKRVERVLLDFQPDIVHALHVMKLSGAVLNTCHKLGLPFLVTLCDFWPICPRHTLLTWDGQLCNGPSHALACLDCLHHTHGSPSVSTLRPSAEDSSKALSTIRRVAALTCHSAMQFRRNPFLKAAILKADRIISLSGFQKQMFVRNGYPESRLDMIPHGLETDGLDPHPERPGRRSRLVFVGSLVEHKGPHVLLEALQQIPDARVELDIYGAIRKGNPYCDRLVELGRRDSRVRLCGTVSLSELNHVLSSADVLAAPALWYENEPLIVKAALYTGLPVLASRLGSLSGMIAHGGNGWLVDPGDVSDWARHIADVGSAPLSGQTAMRIKSMDDNAAELFAIYAAVVEGRERLAA